MKQKEVKEFIIDMFLPEVWNETTIIGKFTLYPLSLAFMLLVLVCFIPLLPIIWLERKLEESGIKERWHNLIHKRLKIPQRIRNIFLRTPTHEYNH